ncbi:MAG: dependent ligase [Gemmatimonadetes bacterium]|nr:dependent ligase [Gemmatimonadota bacterium]
MTQAQFIPPMLLLKTEQLPGEAHWFYQLKLDGYRAIAFKTAGKVHLRSRNDKDFGSRYPLVVNALAKMPDETVVDGEVVAFDAEGRPSFNALQNYGSAAAPVVYFIFDVMVLRGVDLRRLPLEERVKRLEKTILPKLSEPVRYSGPLNASLRVLIDSVKAQGLEGLVAKRRDSVYESGLRSGAWQKMRVNRGPEFVIGGYTLGTRTFDALIFGFYKGNDLIYVARTRNGFTPASRLAVFKKFAGLETAECPFANLPEPRGGRWGQGLTAEKMKECVWLKPRLVAQIEFLEWTAGNHLRHTKFVGLRHDKNPRDVKRELEAAPCSH